MMTTHLASWGKMNFQRHKAKPNQAVAEPQGVRDSPKRSPGRSMSGYPSEQTEKPVNYNNNQHSRQQTVGAVLTDEQKMAFPGAAGKTRTTSFLSL